MSIGADELKAADIRISRIEAIQPRLSIDDLSEGLLHTEDPVLLHGLSNLIRVWASLHPELPANFAEHVKVVEACRQPICWVTVESQQVQRSIVGVTEPFAGGNVDSRPFASQDPFNLAPIAPVEFPVDSLSQQYAVAGQESIAECITCQAAGATTCENCGGDGTISCRECEGTRSVICSRCQGAGSHQGVSGRIIQCQLCRTRGTIQCTACTGGRVPCITCDGNGEITCHVCEGHRNLKRRWEVVSHTKTIVRRRHFMQQPWRIPLESLLADGDELGARTWEWPGRNLADQPIDIHLPEEIASITKDLLEQSLSGVSPSDGTSERITGIRTRVSATYGYRLKIDHDGRTGQLLLAGAPNRVFIENLPTSRAGWFGKIVEATQRKLSAVDMADRVGPPPELVAAIKSGTVHISDSRCLVPRAAALFRADCQVTAEGYRITVGFGSSANQPVTFETTIEHDKYGQWIVRTFCRIGIAHREQAPTALTINAALSFGKLAITSCEGKAEEYFDLFDIRPYEQISVLHLSQILQSIAIDVATLRQRRLLA